MREDSIIAYVDKTIVRITGLTICGLKPNLVEKTLAEYINHPVRVIGVTSDSLQMDIYGLEEEAVLRDEEGIVKVISTVPGLLATEVAKIDRTDSIRTVTADQLLKMDKAVCAKERWLKEQ